MGIWAWVIVGLVVVAALIWFVRSTFSFEFFADAEDEIAAAIEPKEPFYKRFRVESYEVDEEGNETLREPKEPLYKRYAAAGWSGFAWRVVAGVFGLIAAIWRFQDGGIGNVILGVVISLALVVPPAVIGTLIVAGWLRDR